jgi:hypothetical protein
MADDIQNQPAETSVAEQPVAEAIATEQVEQVVATKVVEEPSDLVMADSTTTTTELTATITADAAADDVTAHHSVAKPAVVEGTTEAPAAEAKTDEVPVATEEVQPDNNKESLVDADGDVDMTDHHEDEGEYSDDGSEYEPEAETPPPVSKTPKAKQQKSPTVKKTPTTTVGDNTATPSSSVGDNAQSPQTPQGTRPPKTPASRVRSGRVEKSGTPGSVSNLRCPVKGCGQTFTGRNPRQSLWHHLKYYATRGLPDRVDFEKAHGEAHAEMKRDAGKSHSHTQFIS